MDITVREEQIDFIFRDEAFVSSKLGPVGCVTCGMDLNETGRLYTGILSGETMVRCSCNTYYEIGVGREARSWR